MGCAVVRLVDGERVAVKVRIAVDGHLSRALVRITLRSVEYRSIHLMGKLVQLARGHVRHGGGDDAANGLVRLGRGVKEEAAFQGVDRA